MDEKIRKLNSAQEFLVDHKVHDLIEVLTAELVQVKPNHPVDFLINRLQAVKGGVTAEAKRPHIIFILGGPGSGKGTQCSNVVEEYGCVHISAGDLMRQEVRLGTDVGKEVSECIDTGKLVPSSVVISLLQKEIASRQSCDKTIVIEGFPKDLAQAINFERMAHECAKVINLEAPDAVLKERLIERGKYSHRSDDTPNAIQTRLALYNSKARPVLEYYNALGKLTTIDSSQPVDKVWADLAPCFT
eukprot:TRINITY_DN2611_c5_g1_i1.p1 TRINITY_DN2611_c5_g1~~TRINITY_DN2611_c5_g1_i1.p1  ORF type:complete len:262 (+),score=44.29 TRINITY_DN2611_c5_g1_i1:54-788(+)